MRRKLAIVVVGLLAAGGTGIASIVASSSATAATTLTVIEHAQNDHVTDVGKEGLGRGDLLTFRNPIYDQTNTTQVGTDQGLCVRLSKFKENNSGSWECEWTTFLDDGASSINRRVALLRHWPGSWGNHGRYRGLRGCQRLARPELH
jgi:hypothetical protein